MAYESNASGEFEIYLRPFPGVDEGLSQISAGGGTQPLWGRDGRELFSWAAGGGLMAVPVTTNQSFEAGAAQRLFDGAYRANSGAFPGRMYDVSPDGERFNSFRTRHQRRLGP